MPELSTAAFSYRHDPAVPDYDDSKPLFVFDGICVLCSGGANWLMRVDRNAKVNLTSAQEKLGSALYKHYGRQIDDSYLFIRNGRAYEASRGYFELCHVLGWPWKLLLPLAIIPESWRDWLYGQIAKNRYRWFGKVEYCTLLTPSQRARLI